MLYPLEFKKYKQISSRMKSESIGDKSQSEKVLKPLFLRLNLAASYEA